MDPFADFKKFFDTIGFDVNAPKNSLPLLNDDFNVILSKIKKDFPEVPFKNGLPEDFPDLERWMKATKHNGSHIKKYRVIIEENLVKIKNTADTDASILITIRKIEKTINKQKLGLLNGTIKLNY